MHLQLTGSNTNDLDDATSTTIFCIVMAEHKTRREKIIALQKIISCSKSCHTQSPQHVTVWCTKPVYLRATHNLLCDQFIQSSLLPINFLDRWKNVKLVVIIPKETQVVCVDQSLQYYSVYSSNNKLAYCLHYSALILTNCCSIIWSGDRLMMGVQSHTQTTIHYRQHAHAAIFSGQKCFAIVTWQPYLPDVLYQ